MTDLDSSTNTLCGRILPVSMLEGTYRSKSCSSSTSKGEKAKTTRDRRHEYCTVILSLGGQKEYILLQPHQTEYRTIQCSCADGSSKCLIRPTDQKGWSVAVVRFDQVRDEFELEFRVGTAHATCRVCSETEDPW